MEYIRLLKGEELKDLHYVQKDIWGFRDIDIVPYHFLKEVSDILSPNGMILGYIIDEKIVGFLITLPTSDPKKVLFEIGGVCQNYQNRGIFYKLLLEMKNIMTSNNIEKIFATFDPLESVNAHLYIRKLGGIITGHYTNYYGILESELHHSMSTDRFIIEWDLKDSFIDKIEKYIYISNTKYVEIPLNIQELKTKNIDEAISWRMKTRNLFEKYISNQQFIGIDYIIDNINKKGIYVLKKFSI